MRKFLARIFVDEKICMILVIGNLQTTDDTIAETTFCWKYLSILIYEINLLMPIFCMDRGE